MTRLLCIAALALTACVKAPPVPVCPFEVWAAHVAQCRVICDDERGDSECVYACEDANQIEGCKD